MMKSWRTCLGALGTICLTLACVARRGADPARTSELPFMLPATLFDTSGILRATVAQWRIESSKAEETAKERIKALGGDPDVPLDSAMLRHVWTGKPSRWLRDLAQA